MSANQWPYVSRADAEKEIAHAVALERERIAAYVDRVQLVPNRPYSELRNLLAALIRTGAHNPESAQGVTTSPGAATRATQTSNGPTDTSNDVPGPQTAETGMDSCRPSPESEDA